MAVDVIEIMGSRDLKSAVTNGRGKFAYALLSDNDNQNEIGAALEAELVPSFTYLGDVYLLQDHKINQKGPGVWYGDANYATELARGVQFNYNTGDSFTSFDTTGGTFHLTEAEATEKYGDSAPDVGNTINVRNNKAEGVDIVVPALNFTYTHYFPADQINAQYIVNLARNTGKTNATSWQGFATGELLFTGANGTLRRAKKDWEIAFNFTASENIDEEFDIGDITVDMKGGHEYLWVMYEKLEDGVEKIVIPQPIGVYVNQIYKSFNFSSLGI